MSIQLQNIIDREELDIDSHKLAEFNKNDRFKKEIDEMVEKFIDNNISADDFESITMVYKLANKIKEKIKDIF